jgi:hypothetical protein
MHCQTKSAVRLSAAGLLESDPLTSNIEFTVDVLSAGSLGYQFSTTKKLPKKRTRAEAPVASRGQSRPSSHPAGGLKLSTLGDSSHGSRLISPSSHHQLPHSQMWRLRVSRGSVTSIEKTMLITAAGRQWVTAPNLSPVAGACRCGQRRIPEHLARRFRLFNLDARYWAPTPTVGATFLAGIERHRGREHPDREAHN